MEERKEAKAISDAYKMAWNLAKAENKVSKGAGGFTWGPPDPHLRAQVIRQWTHLRITTLGTIYELRCDRDCDRIRIDVSRCGSQKDKLMT